MSHIPEATHTGPWSNPVADSQSSDLMRELRQQQERLDTWSKLAHYLIQDRERQRLGREPSEEELLRARQSLGSEVAIPSDFTTENELRKALLDANEENARMREFSSHTAPQMSGRRNSLSDERIEALRAEATMLQNRTESLEIELRKERKEHRVVLAEKREWEELEEEYLSKIEQLRNKLTSHTHSLTSEHDKGKIDLIKKNQEEVTLLRKNYDESRRKNELLQKQMDTLNSRLMDKDQGAEVAYQKSLQFQEIQRQELTKQLNWVIAEQARERAEYESELTLREKEMQALETKSQIRSDFNKQIDVVPLAVQQANQTADAKLRDDLDRVRLDSEKHIFQQNTTIRELELQLNTQKAEMTSLVTKCERAEKTSQERYARLTQYQDKITALNTEIANLEREKEAIESQASTDLAKAHRDHKKRIDTLEYDLVVLKENKEMVESGMENEAKRRREEIRSRESAYTELSAKLEEESMARRKDRDSHVKEVQMLKDSVYESEMDVRNLKEEKVLLEDENSRVREKQEDLMRELRITTDNSTRLMDRDSQLVAECHNAKICWHQCKLELERSERERSRLMQQNSTLRRQVTTTDPLLLLASKPSRARTSFALDDNFRENFLEKPRSSKSGIEY
eukprot:TRINITY_DN16116_c0_g1_i1.p1 TRINITY_DN16116_c0_g1~~TRINITY_DN16116_c0_g1_i1.p1  ORF type:complete len:629 (+),score=171.41 TRINITY_DN16116_c0_g1_i1:52-1938(+)